MKTTKYFTAPWCGPCKMFKPVVHEVIAEGYDIEEITHGTNADPNLITVEEVIKSINQIKN